MTAPDRDDLARAVEALERVRDYFDQRADADAQGDPIRYVGNEAMHRLRDCDEILAALKRGEAERQQLLREREQAVAAEREACAKVCEEWSDNRVRECNVALKADQPNRWMRADAGAQSAAFLAAAIRARGQRKEERDA